MDRAILGRQRVALGIASVRQEHFSSLRVWAMMFGSPNRMESVEEVESFGLRRVLHGVARLSGAYVLNGILGILFIPLALHKLGEVGYAVLSVYAFTLSYLVLCELGVGKNLLREIAAAHDESSRLGHLHRALSAYMVIGCFVVTATPIAAWVLPRWVIPFAPSLRAEVGLVVGLAVADYLLGIIVALHNSEAMARGRVANYARFQAFSGLLRYGGGIAVLLFVPAPSAVLVCTAFAGRRLIEIPLAMLVLGRLPLGAWRAWKPSFRVTKTLSSSASLSLAQLLQTSMISVGNVLISHSAGPAALGVFRSSFDLATKIWFMSGAFGLVLFPRFARLQVTEAGRRVLASVLPAALRLSAAFLALMGVLGMLLASSVLPLLGLRGDLAVMMFVLSLGGATLFAQATAPFELLLAKGWFFKAAVRSAIGLMALYVVFIGLSGLSPLVALGWAWLASQAVYAASCRQAIDGLLHEKGVRRWRWPSDELLTGCVLGAAAYAILSGSVPVAGFWALVSVILMSVILLRGIPALATMRAELRTGRAS